MTISHEQAEWFRSTFDQLTDNMEKAVLGKRHVVRLALTCLLSEGHILLEDFPGTGKTMLARSLANLDTVDFYGSPGGTVTIDCFNALGQRAQAQFIW